jgi:hypothetical protein
LGFLYTHVQRKTHCRVRRLGRAFPTTIGIGSNILAPKSWCAA